MSGVERRTGKTQTTSIIDRSLLTSRTVVDRLTGRQSSWSFRRRRVKSLVAVFASVAIFASIVRWFDDALLDVRVMTGWTVMVCLFALMAIGLRRRIPVLPLGTMATWTQVHLYTGLFAIGGYVLHVPATWNRGPLISGWLEGSLAWLFWLVAGSGIYGWIACRRLPTKLSILEPQVRFDQIQWHRQQIHESAIGCVEALRSPDASGVLGEFYEQHLSSYFSRQPSWLFLMIPQSKRRRRLLSGLRDLERYLGDEGRNVCGHLSGLIRRRDDLDYQTALQLRLRGWVLIHGVLSLSLLVVAVIHGWIAYRFIES